MRQIYAYFTHKRKFPVEREVGDTRRKEVSIKHPWGNKRIWNSQNGGGRH